MSYINDEVRATKAYRIISQATNVHLDLVEMINRLSTTGDRSQQFICAAAKVLTDKRHKHCFSKTLERYFFYTLQITGNSYQEKVDQLNEFGNDIHLSDIEEYRHEVETFGLNYDSPSLQDNPLNMENEI